MPKGSCERPLTRAVKTHMNTNILNTNDKRNYKGCTGRVGVFCIWDGTSIPKKNSVVFFRSCNN